MARIWDLEEIEGFAVSSEDGLTVDEMKQVLIRADEEGLSEFLFTEACFFGAYFLVAREEENILIKRMVADAMAAADAEATRKHPIRGLEDLALAADGSLRISIVFDAEGMPTREMRVVDESDDGVLYSGDWREIAELLSDVDDYVF